MKRYIGSILCLIGFAFLLTFGAWQFLKSNAEMPATTVTVNVGTSTHTNVDSYTATKAPEETKPTSQYTGKEQKSGELETLMKQIADLTR